MRSPLAWINAKADALLDERIAWISERFAVDDPDGAAIGLDRTIRLARSLAQTRRDDERPAEALRLAGQVLRDQGHTVRAHRLYAEVLALGDASDHSATVHSALIAALAVALEREQDDEDDASGDESAAVWLPVWTRCEDARDRFGGNEASAQAATITTVKLVTAYLESEDPARVVDHLRSYARWADPAGTDDGPEAVLTAAMPRLMDEHPEWSENVFGLMLCNAALEPEFRITCGSYLAQYHEHRGNLPMAHFTRAEALRVLPHDVLGPRRRADLLFDVARLADTLGRYAEAYERYQDCLWLQQATLPEDDRDLLTTRHNLMELVRYRGDVVRAADEFAALAAIHRNRAGAPGQPDDLGWVLLHLAQCDLASGRPADAARSCAEALALPVTRPMLRYRLHEVADLAARDSGDSGAPSPEYVAAVDGLAAEYGADSPEFLEARAKQAALLADGDLAAAEGALVELLDRAGGRDTGELRAIAGSTATLLACVRLDRGDVGGAAAALGPAAELWQDEYVSRWRIGSVVGAGPDEPWPIREPLIRLAATAGPHRPEALALAFRIVTGAKGLQADAVARQRDAILEGRTALLSLQFHAAALRRASLSGGDTHATTSDGQRLDVRDIEDLMARQIPAASLRRSFENATPEAVAGALPPDTTLVEYAHLGGGYVAFVLPAGEPDGLVLVELAAAGPIDAAVAALRRGIQASGRGLSDRPEEPAGAAWRDEAARLSAAIWEPVAAMLPPDGPVVIAPDGPLHAVPFDVLPDAGGAPMLATRVASQVATGRDLLTTLTRPNWQTLTPVVIAAPAFGPDAPFGDLPGAAAEGREVAELLGAGFAAGPDATREVLQGLTDPEILHLATHGFGVDPLAGVTAGGAAGRPESLPEHGGPLTTSGLAFAGAEVVTALEILDLPLMGTDLVVLSACESGLGPSTAGAGLAGLARSFLLAGARTAVWSLWRVDDDGTRLLMREFYTRLLAGAPRATALHEAKRHLYGMAPDRPDLWASFVAQGDPGALLRFRETDIPLEQVYRADAVRVRDLPAGHEFAMFDPDTHIMDKGGRPIGVFRVGGRNVARINMRGLSPGGEFMSRGERLFDQATAEKDRGEAALDGGDPHTADVHYRRGLDLLGQLRDETRDDEIIRLLDGVRAVTLSRLAMCAHERREYELAREHGEHAVRLYERVGLSDLAYAVALENLGIAMWNLGDEAMAPVLVRQALAVKRRVCPDDKEQLAFTRTTLAAFTGRGRPTA